MIQPPDMIGVAFTDAGDGDQRGDPEARKRASAALGIGADWSSLRQVHGNSVFEAAGPGEAGVGDALWTRTKRLPIAVFTADCFGVVLRAAGAVGVAHAGWRGAQEKVVSALRSAMTDAGYPPHQAAIGPGIESCCFEVGDDVVKAFQGQASTTTWGTVSVDLRSSIKSELAGLEVWESAACTRHQREWYSHRRDATPSRQASIGWLS